LSKALLDVGFMMYGIEDVVPRIENDKAVTGALVLLRNAEIRIQLGKKDLIISG
jgi:hypothetical protein